MCNTSVLEDMPASQSLKCSWPMLKELDHVSRPQAFTGNMGFLPSIAGGFRSVQPLSHVQLFATTWIAACQASLSITISRSSLRLNSFRSMMSSSHLILGRPLLLPPIPPRIRVFSNESTLHMRWPKYWSFGTPQIKSLTVSIVSPAICHEVMGPDAIIFIFWMLSFKPACSLSSYSFIRNSLIPLSFLP